ncbi:uncharacterized protein LOC107876167 isoform X2 [Capsicum annuum]|uniref:uncharacterized protein LOC107876167 isoform X2 n=1 Tax=Capsicum annuum TaxID=4072 RepID=UPI0007BEE444|nr:uncharacterized protein LOC107876167 isoform X2 [Capsicum annuum]
MCIYFYTPKIHRNNEAVVYDRRQSTKKSNIETTALPFTSSHENRRDKRKEIDAPFHSLPPTVMKDKGKAIAEPFSSLSPETKKDKGKGVVILSNPVSGNKAVVDNRRQTAKRCNLEVTALPVTSSHENEKDERKENDEPFVSLPPTIMKDKGKAIAEPFSILPPETKKDKGKGEVILHTPVLANKKKKGFDEPFMSSSPQKVKAKAQTISHKHLSSDENAAEEKFGVLSRSCSSLKKTREKGMSDASVFSCPTLPKRRRTNRTEVSGAGDIKPSGSRTDPIGKRNKRRCTQQKLASEAALPQDFVNYWREHFKEIDEFELPEEEASYSDLD